jgi:Tat protein secretion system quality control protein TatD with DNase activity
MAARCAPPPTCWQCIPRHLLLLETDAPWCDIRPTHPGYKFIATQMATHKPEKFVLGKCVKGHNEPMHITQVVEVLAGARQEGFHVYSAPSALSSFTFYV